MRKKVPNSITVKTVLKWGGKKKVYGSENADYKIMHYNYINMYLNRKDQREAKKCNFYTKELKQWKCIS